MKKITPTKDNLLIEKPKVKETTDSGIVLPDNVKEAPQTGLVIAVGPDTTIKVGTEVFYAKYSGVEVSLDDQEYLLCKEEDILATIKEES